MTAGFLRLAVPNKGRLRTPCLDLLASAGLRFEANERALSVRVDNADIDLLFVRTEDIPELVADGVADLGITGVDLLSEFGRDLSVVRELGFGRCRLAAAVPNGSDLVKIDDLDGRRVATAHPGVTDRFFADRNLEISVVPLRGSVEVATKLGVADAIVDLVSTGSTLAVNGLREVGTLLESQAILIAPTEMTESVPRIVTAIGSVVAARHKRYVLLNAPTDAVGEVAELIPGLSAPTVIPLADPAMAAIHSVVDADEVWHLLPRLEAAGARGILVLPISQLIS